MTPVLRLAPSFWLAVIVSLSSAPARGGDGDRARPIARAGLAADAGPPAWMTCDHVPGPGRVPCAVEAHVGPGESIRWGDVVLVATPPFVAALRGRIGPHDATVRDAAVWRWGLALVAREPGRGRVEGRVRLVVCRGAVCSPREVTVEGEVEVGGGPSTVELGR
jgi:hypothetical protein